jgi:hypothetical protein
MCKVPICICPSAGLQAHRCTSRPKTSTAIHRTRRSPNCSSSWTLRGVESLVGIPSSSRQASGGWSSKNTGRSSHPLTQAGGSRMLRIRRSSAILPSNGPPPQSWSAVYVIRQTLPVLSLIYLLVSSCQGRFLCGTFWCAWRCVQQRGVRQSCGSARMPSAARYES